MFSLEPYFMLSLQTHRRIMCVKPTPSLCMHYRLEPGVATFTCFHCRFSLIGQYLYTFISTPLRTVLLADIDDVHVFAQRFLAFVSGTRQHLQWCSSVHRALPMSGDVTTLPHLLLALSLAHCHFTALALCATACTNSIW